MLAIASALEESELIELSLAIPAGWIAYLAAIWLLAPDSIAYLRRTMFPGSGSGGSTAA